MARAYARGMGSPGNEHPADIRDACARAVVDRGIGPAEVARLVTAGDLEPGLAAHPVPPATVSSWGNRLRKRRAGKVETDHARTPAAERIAELQRRLLNAAEHEIAALERQQRAPRRRIPCTNCGELTGPLKGEPVDGERLRQLARALREAAAIAPTPRAPGAAGEQPRTTPPGQRDPDTGEHAGARTRGGLAGAVLRDLAGEDRTAPSTSPSGRESDATPESATEHLENTGTTTPASDASESAPPTDASETESEGAADAVRWAREQVAALEHREPVPPAATGSGYR